VIKPSSDEYNATTDVSQRGRWVWWWRARLWQPHPWTPFELDTDDGFALTRQRAERKAERAARRMMRAADSWVSRTYKADGTEEDR
jgi:hypothetical protein